MYLKDSKECLQNPQTKHDNSQTTTGIVSPPTDNYVHVCKQDASAKQGSSSLGWNITLVFFRKKQDAVRDGSGENGDPGSSDAQPNH